MSCPVDKVNTNQNSQGSRYQADILSEQTNLPDRRSHIHTEEVGRTLSQGSSDQQDNQLPLLSQVGRACRRHTQEAQLTRTGNTFHKGKQCSCRFQDCLERNNCRMDTDSELMILLGSNNQPRKVMELKILRGNMYHKGKA
jgi:hypothetical protein